MYLTIANGSHLPLDTLVM